MKFEGGRLGAEKKRKERKKEGTVCELGFGVPLAVQFGIELEKKNKVPFSVKEGLQSCACGGIRVY